MAKVIDRSHWQGIISYITEILTKAGVEPLDDIDELLSYDSYVEYIVPKKKVKKELPREVQEAWDKWWKLWPSMRSFEYQGKKFVCNKPLKKGEEKMKEKWLAIITKEIGADWLYTAAEKFLKSTMIDSVRKGRNEMEYVNGMEPWLNGKLWRNWMETEVIEEIQQMQKLDRVSSDVNI